MKKHIRETFVKRCYFCPDISMSSECKRHSILRTFVCNRLEKIIDTAELLTSNRKYKKAPIVHQDDWFPDWCPLENVINEEE